MLLLDYQSARESGPAIVEDPEPQVKWVVVTILVGALLIGTCLAVK